MPDSSVSTAVRALAGDLIGQATATDQRRLLVLSGDHDAGWDAAFTAIEETGVDDDAVTFVTTREGVRFDRVSPARADSLLGTTRTVVVCDAHEEFSPNLLGRLSGVVDGGGLLVLLTPPLDEWHASRTHFDESLVVPPFPPESVTGRFRRRLVDLLRAHPGVAIVEVDGGDDGDGADDSDASDDADAGGDERAIRRDGAMDDDVFVGGRAAPSVPDRAAFPRTAYEACRTYDQSRALAALERLRDGDGREAVVVEADRGRGKSSAAGLAAACLAREGRDVLVTAPQYRNAREGFVRALELFARLGVEASHDEAAHVVRLEETGGRIRFCRPTAVAETETPDVLLVDEAAALPVHLLSSFLDAPRVAFFTTVHGYEGAGRGFTVRFRDRLDESGHTVTDVRLDDPIRYARGDPVESLAFRALLLDARPPVDQVVAEATPETVAYRTLTPDDLLADEHRLREAFGLLVLAHYRTEPNDLARLLDAPNLTLRALTHEGHVVSVALLAREGGLDAETRRDMYEGARVRGNMLPDVLTSQVRDEEAAAPVGYRVMRIATHHAVRSRGLGSALLSEIRDELSTGDPLSGRLGAADRPVDWFGVGYGATPPLVSFWNENGFSTLYLSTSRNETSGEHSVVMLDGLSPTGAELHDRHTAWFLDRAEGVLSDPLRDLDPDVVRTTVRATDREFSCSLTDREWRVVVDASFGPGLYSVNPRPFRLLALWALTRPPVLDAEQERLLVRKVLQAHPWDVVADELDFVSTGQCMKALGRAYQSLVDAAGGEVAARYQTRYTDTETE